jgi:hypothetical protein
MDAPDIEWAFEVDVPNKEGLESQRKHDAGISGQQCMVDEFVAQMEEVCPGLIDKCRHMVFAVDTGCTVTLIQCALECMLSDKCASGLRVQGFKGAQASRASSCGRVHFWAVGTHGERPADHTGAYSVKAHAMPGLNSNLLSLNAPIMEDRVRLMLMSPEHGSSTMVRFPVGGEGTVTMPVRYNAVSRHWVLSVWAAKDPADAENCGRMYEQFFEQNGGTGPAEVARACAAHAYDVSPLSTMCEVVTRHGAKPLAGELFWWGQTPTRGAHPVDSGSEEPDFGIVVADSEKLDSGVAESIMGSTTDRACAGQGCLSREQADEIVRSCSTSALVTCAIEFDRSHGDLNWYQIDNRFKCLDNRVYVREVLTEIWGDQASDIWEGKSRLFPASWTAHAFLGAALKSVDSESEMTEWRRVCSNADAVSALSELRDAWAAPLGSEPGVGPHSIFRVMKHREDAGSLGVCDAECWRASMGRRLVSDVMNLAWHQPNYWNVFVGGPALYGSKWNFIQDGPVPGVTDMKMVLAMGDHKVRTYMRKWLLSSDLKISTTRRAVVQGVKSFIHNVFRPKAVISVVGAPGGSKHSWFASRSQLGWQSAGRDIVFKNQDFGSNIGVAWNEGAASLPDSGTAPLPESMVDSGNVTRVRAIAKVMSIAHSKPGVGVRTVSCGDSSCVIPFLLSAVMCEEIELAEFTECISDLTRSGWIAPAMVFTGGDFKSNLQRIRCRGAAGDTHVCPDVLARAMAGWHFWREIVACEGSITVHEYMNMDTSVGSCIVHANSASSVDTCVRAWFRGCNVPSPTVVTTTSGTVPCSKGVVGVERASPEPSPDLRRSKRKKVPTLPRNGKPVPRGSKFQASLPAIMSNAERSGAKASDELRMAARVSAWAEFCSKSTDKCYCVEYSDVDSDNLEMGIDGFNKVISELSRTNVVISRQDSVFGVLDAQGLSDLRSESANAVTGVDIEDYHECALVGDGVGEDVIPGDANHGGDPMAKMYFENDGVISGIRSQLKGALARAPEKLMHSDKCHFPWRGDCAVCRSSLGVFKGVRVTVDPHVDERSCHTFYADMIVFDTRSRNGNKYLFAMRDGCGYLCGFVLANKSDLSRVFGEWLRAKRRDSNFSHHPWAFCSHIKLDCAGEQAPDNAEFNLMLGTFDPEPGTTYVDPQQHSAAGNAENTMRWVEIGIKALLKQTSMPPEFWEDAWLMFLQIANWVPRRKDVVSKTGDTVLPLERATCERIDRKTILYWFKCFVGLGILCMCKVPAKGSSLTKFKFRWGVVLGLTRGTPDLPVFFCPVKGTGVTFRTKHYVIVRREVGVTYQEFLGVTPLVPSIRSLPRIGDNRINNLSLVIQIADIDKWGEGAGLTPGEPNVPASHLVQGRGMATPKVFLVDKKFNMWNGTGKGGVFVKDKPLLHRLASMGHIPKADGLPALEHVSKAKVEQMLVRLDQDPLWVVSANEGNGIVVYKRYSQGVFKGRITGYSVENFIWTVTYDMVCPFCVHPDNEVEEFSRESVRIYAFCEIDKPQEVRDSEAGDSIGTAPPAGGGDGPDFSILDPYQVQAGDSQPVWMRAVVETMPHVISEPGDTVFDVANAIDGLPPEEYVEYYEWLGDAYGHLATNEIQGDLKLGVEFFKPFTTAGRPVRNQTILPSGTIFPVPSGPRWRQILDRRSAERVQYARAALVKEMMVEGEQLAREYTQDLRVRGEAEPDWISQSKRTFGVYSSVVPKATHEDAKLVQVARGLVGRFVNRAAAVTMRSVRKDWDEVSRTEKWDLSPYTVNGRVLGPKTLTEAQSRVDWPRWKDAYEVEFGSIEDMEVFIHGITKGVAESKYGMKGARLNPLDLASLFDVKYTVASPGKPAVISKYKVRRVVKAHKGKARKGVHYQDTWAAAPNVIASRLIGIIGLQRSYHRMCTDIAVAFLHGNLEPHEYVLVRYEKDLRKTDADGNELYAICRKTLYGLPQSPRYFGQAVDDWLMTEFNSNGWTVRKAVQEPCLYIFRAPAPVPDDSGGAEAGGAGAGGAGAGGAGAGGAGAGGATRGCGPIPPEAQGTEDPGAWEFDRRLIYMVRHVDDLDMCGARMEDLQCIRDAFQERFGVKDCSPDEMLGVRRERSADGQFLELTMAGFVEHLHEKFKEHCGNRTRNVPMREHTMLTRLDCNPEEAERVLARGLRELAGGILWLWRMCMAQLGPAINQVCKMMSAPTEATWDAAIQILEYAYQHRHEGIRYRRDGNRVPVSYYDSGGKPDPKDAKSQHGHVVLLGDGPLSYVTRKHKHVGSAGTMGVEWMSLGWCVKDTVAIRMLMQDMGAIPRDAHPTPVIGDNLQAVDFANEEKMTSAMRHVREQYHLSREWAGTGDIKCYWIPGTENPSDIVSKPVAKQVLDKLLGMLTGYAEGVLKYLVPPKPRVSVQRDTVHWEWLDMLGPRFLA